MRHDSREAREARSPAARAFALACACCRAPGDPDRDELVRRLAAETSWSAVEALAGRHRIEGLVFAALRRAGVEPPAPFGARLRDRAAAIAAAGLRQAAESVRLQAAFDAAGVANLLIKGVAVEVLAWGRIGVKQAWDIDVLVEEGDIDRAGAVLAGLGYALARPAGLDAEGWRLWIAQAKEAEWVHRLTGEVVELHWRLTDAATLLPGLNARSPARATPLAAGSPATIRTLGAEETFAYLCVHGASHAWIRLKWLADVDALLAPLSPAERLDLHRRAIDLGAGRCTAVAMMLCRRLFDLALPAALVEDIGRDRRTRALAALAMAAMRAGGSGDIAERPLLGDAILLSQLLFADGAGFLGAELRRQWTSLDDRLRLRLPPALAPLYPLARVPLWMWRRLRPRIGRPGQTRERALMVRKAR
jgi:hypothetical protein